MRRPLLVSVLFLAGCATFPPRPGADRTRLWEQGHDAFAADSLRVAAAAFQRLTNEHPHSREGHEARFYLGVLALEPASGLDLSVASEQLAMYLVEDSIRSYPGYHRAEAATLLRLAGDLRRPCAERTNPALRCTAAAPTRAADAPAAEGSGNAEAARLRREIAERDETIRRLRDELERIRNTLAPRRTPR